MREQCKKVAAFLRRWKPAETGKSILLAVSGGMDSMVMLDIFRELQEPLGLKLAVSCFDHQLRPESPEEADFVAKTAATYGLPCYLGQGDVRSLAAGGNLEDVARRERYRFLREVAAKIGANCIATAHHQSDQAETLLLHLLRGCGTAGLAAISPKEGDLIRPLLCLSRQEIETYAAGKGLEYREDQSNFSHEYQRNRVRWELLPLLKTYNPQIIPALNATAEICREEDAFMDELAAEKLAELQVVEGKLPRASLASLPLALARRVLKRFAAQSLPAALNYGQSEALLNLKEGQSISLSGGMLAFCRDGNLQISAEIPQLPSFHQVIPLKMTGEEGLPLENWGWRYSCTPWAGEATRQQAWDRYQFFLPVTALADCRWRTRRQGDHLPSSGGKGYLRLKEVFIDQKILPSQRECWPLLLYGESICWVPGLWHRNEGISGEKLLIKVWRSDIIR